MSYVYELARPLALAALLPLGALAQTAGVGIGITTPLSRLHVADGSVLFSAAGDVPGSSSIPITGAGRRLLWYADKAAFRVGYVGSYGSAYWDNSNIGTYSFATGYNPRASGQYSFAAGLTTTASGEASVALGNNGTANADRALSFNGTASGVGAIALGSGAQATSDDALALGPSSIASGLASVVLGPSTARGNFGVAIGLQNSASGQFSVAIGKNARTNRRQGAIVIGDGCAGFSSDSLYATANNQVNMRGCGGYRLFTNQNLSAGVLLAPGGGSWTSVSDRRKKENIRVLDPEQVLRKVATLPISEWNYKAQPATQRHIGPMAQDFYQAFHLDGINADTTINALDIDGVNMVAIQALEKRTARLQQENELLRAQLHLQQEQVRLRDEQLRAKDEQVTAQLQALAERLAALEPSAPAPARRESARPMAAK